MKVVYEIEKRYKKAKKITIWGIAVNIVLAGIKLIVGLMYNSAALTADAAHSLSDLFSSFVVLIGMRIASRPEDKNHPYGHEKLEAVAAKLLAIILITTAVFIGWNAINNLVSPSEYIPSIPVLAVAAISILMKETMYHFTRRVAVEIGSNTLMADAWHHRSDALSSIAVLLGAGASQLGFLYGDAIAALVVSLMVAWTGITIYRQSVYDLTDTAASSDVEQEICSIVTSTEMVRDVSWMKTRHHGNRIFVDMAIEIDGDMSVEDSHSIASHLKNKLKEELPIIKEVLIHVNPYNKNESQKH